MPCQVTPRIHCLDDYFIGEEEGEGEPVYEYDAATELHYLASLRRSFAKTLAADPKRAAAFPLVLAEGIFGRAGELLPFLEVHCPTLGPFPRARAGAPAKPWANGGSGRRQVAEEAGYRVYCVEVCRRPPAPRTIPRQWPAN